MEFANPQTFRLDPEEITQMEKYVDDDQLLDETGLTSTSHWVKRRRTVETIRELLSATLRVIR